MRAIEALRQPCLARFAAIFLIAVLTVPFGTAGAQSGGTGDAVAPVTEFSRELDNLKRTFGDLSRQIEESARSIDRVQSGEGSRKEIEQLRDVVGKLLGEVADNGTVSQLGAKALAHAQAKLKSLQRETRFTPQQLQFLIQEWK